MQLKRAGLGLLMSKLVAGIASMRRVAKTGTLKLTKRAKGVKGLSIIQRGFRWHQ